jgi:hypothetical protein
VREKVYVGGTAMSGAQAADEVCDTILSRGLASGEAAILLQDFPKGDGRPGNPYQNGPALVFHHEDGLDNTAITEWWRTPWTTHGIPETRAWMNEFIQRYRDRQAADARIPDPARFHFDTELYPAVCCESYWINIFDQMRWQDPRYNNEPVAGFGTPGAPKTVSQLYFEAGRPSYTPGQPIYASANQAWFKWYFSMGMRATEGAMDEAVYQPIREAWPGCLTSHYYQSMRTDGGGVPARAIPDNGPQGVTWAKFSWQGAADLQSPVLYAVSDAHKVGRETTLEASMRVWKGQIQACIDSFGGGHGDEIVPWTTLPGQQFTEAEMFEVYAMLASKGIDEVIIWGPAATGSAANWTALARAARRVWAADLAEATVLIGTPSVSASLVPARVRWARNDTLAISAPAWTNNVTDLRVAFATPFAGSRKLRVDVESRASIANSKAEVLIRDWSGPSGESWVSLGQQSVATSGLTLTKFADDDAASHVSPDGRVELRVRHFPPAGSPVMTSVIDSIRVIELEGVCEGDASGDGAVDFADITAVLAAWGTQAAAADFDLSGTVDFADITSVLAGWGRSCW